MLDSYSMPINVKNPAKGYDMVIKGGELVKFINEVKS